MLEAGRARQAARRTLAATLLAGLLGLLAACGSEEPTPTPQPDLTAGTSTPATGAQAKAAWEVEWEETLAKAQEEGSLSLALGSGNTREFRPLYKAFQDEFGITMILSGGSGRLAADRILAERGAGLYTVDIAQTGVSTAMGILVPSEVLAPVEPLLFRADVLDKSNWHGNKFWWGDPESKYIFVYSASHNTPGISINTDLIDPDEITSYWDLLEPKYKGMHISGDLGSAGGSSNFHFLFGHPDLGPEFLTRYALETDLTMISDARVAASWMAEGTKAIGMHLGGVYADLVDGLEERGAPVASISHSMIEGTSVMISARDQLMALDNPPHPNAQKLFVNWMLSPAGQLWVQNIAFGGIDSLRTDIPKDMVPAGKRRQEGVDYIFVTTDPTYQALVPESFAFATELAEKWRATQ